MKRVIAVLTLALLLLSGCSSASLEGAGKEVGDALRNVTDADNKYVEMVRGGYRADAPGLTYDEAFSNFFSTPRWSYFKSDDQKDVVEFTGDCMYRDAQVKARIQFVVDEDEGTFEATYLAFNEVPQDFLTMISVIEKAFEEAGSTESQHEDTKILTAQEAEQLINDWIDDGHRMGYVCYPEYVDEGVLGYSGPEVYNFDLMVSQDAWLPVAVEKEGGSMWALLDNDEVMSLDDYYDKFYSDVGDIGGEYEEDVGSIDPLLVGRWRSYDGGTLEFSDSGLITDCDFKCWSVADDKPDRVCCATDNGRVNCTAYFDYSTRYAIFIDSTFDEERLKFSIGSEYRRVDGNAGELLGTWQNIQGVFWPIQFYEDGTGTVNNKYPITWYTYTTEDGQDALNYTIVDATHFDYKCSGSTLTVFLSDSSRVYTKVGS